MKKEIFVDLAIIGAGTAGISAFKEANKVTQKLLLIDQGPLGTTCARVGCMPSKAFIQAANLYYERHYFSERGIEGSEKLKINIPKLMKYVRKTRASFVEGVNFYLDSLNEKLIKGHAEIFEPGVIKVDDQKIIAKKIIIATGSHSFIPKEWQLNSNQILTSENFFEQKYFEEKMVVIGAGVIGLELGQALSRIGIDVVIFHSHDMIGKLTDPEVNKIAINLFEKEYSLLLNQKANVEEKNGTLVVKSHNKMVQTQQILVSLGRKPNLENFDFKKLGITTDSKGMPLFDNTTLQIKNSTLFIAGDASQEKQLLHEVADEGRIAGFNAVHSPQHYHRRTPLAIIFSDPIIAIVGQSYKNLNEKEFIVGEVHFDNQGRSRIMSKNKGILRIYAEPKNGQLLGAEMVAPEGDHLAHLLAWGIQQHLTAFDLLKMPYYHPTVEEGMRTALFEITKQIKPKNTGFELALCDSEAVTCLS